MAGVGRLPADGLGLFVAFYMVHMRLWIAAVPNAGGKLVLWVGGAANKNKDRFEQKFDELVDEIRNELERARHAKARSAQTHGTENASRANLHGVK